MEMHIEDVVMAAGELSDTCPELRVTSIAPAVDGICFHTDDGYTYKYEYASGCIYRSYKTDWRSATATPVLIQKREG